MRKPIIVVVTVIVFVVGLVAVVRTQPHREMALGRQSCASASVVAE